MIRYFATYSGALIDFNNFSYSDIKIEDIAHHLCQINRFGGSLPYDKFYSVAQHSVTLASYIYELTDDPNLALHALLHDASEAYLGDIVSALKEILPDYAALETYFQDVIYDNFHVNVTLEGKALVHYYDKKIMMDEVKALIPDKYHLYATEDNSPIGLSIDISMGKRQVEHSFLWWVETLTERKEKVA